MTEVTHNKLVRDKVPEIIEREGNTTSIRFLRGDEFKSALLAKLIEEAQELLENPSYEERADVEEVLREIDKSFGFTPEGVEEERTAKAKKRGGFKNGIYLEKVHFSGGDSSNEE